MLYLWMPEGNAPWRWRVDSNADWHLAENLEALLDATGASGQKEALVFFPTIQAQLLRQPMTRQQLRQIGAAGVRYLLEEFSLLPVEQLAVHYYLDTSQHLNIMALSQGLVAQYQNILALGSWRIQALLPDFLLVPPPNEPTEAQLIIHQQQRILRADAFMAYSADDLAVLLDYLRGYLPDLTRLNIWGTATVHDQTAISNQAGLSATQQEWLTTVMPLTDAQYIRHPFNALPKTRAQLSGYWRAIAAVFIAALLIQVVYDGVRTWRYHKIANQTYALAVQQYQVWFPDERRIVNLRSQVEGHLQSNSNTDLAVLSLLSRAGPILQQANLPAERVQYGENGLELSVLANGLPALESLRSQLDKQGLRAELGAVNPANGQVSGIIRIQL